MSIEWSIALDCVAEIGGVDFVDEKIDKSHVLTGDVSDIALDMATESYDRSLNLQGEISSIALNLSPQKDWSLGGEAETGKDFDLILDLKRTIAALLTSESEDAAIAVDFLADRAESGEADDPGAYFDLNIGADRSDLADAEVGQGMTLDVLYLMRSILTLPPEGEISVLSTASSESGDVPLDKAVIERGTTAILQLDVLGTRLDAYEIEFFARIEPNSPAIIRKTSSVATGGGIKILGYAPALSENVDSGALQQLVAQIVFQPSDSIIFQKTQTLLFECWLQNEGMGERYRVSRGSFTVSVD